MIKLKVLISYVFLKTADLLEKGKFILLSMKGNGSYPNPVPTVPEYEKLLTDLAIAITAAKSGDRNAIALKNTLRLQVLDATRSWGKYVNFVATGDLTMLTSSGFTLAKQPEPRHVDVPVIDKVEDGLNPGSLVIKMKPATGVRGYLYQITPDPLTKDSVWITRGSSMQKFEFEDLEEGQKYWLRAIALGSKKQEVMSKEVSQFTSLRSNDKAA